MTPILRVVLEAAAVALVAALAVTVVERRRQPRRSRLVTGLVRRELLGARAGSAVLGVVVGWAGSGWPAAGVWLGLLGWAAPTLVTAERDRRAELDAIEARAGWVSLVRGQLAGGSSLASALEVACDRTVGPLAADLAPLRQALSEHTVPEAIGRWRAERAGTAGELGAILAVVAAGQGGRMADLLAQAADSLRARAQAGRRLARERARLRMAARAITALVVVWVVAGGRLDPALFDPAYRGAAGQALLFAVLGLLGGALWWLNRMDRGLEVRW